MKLNTIVLEQDTKWEYLAEVFLKDPQANTLHLKYVMKLTQTL